MEEISHGSELREYRSKSQVVKFPPEVDIISRMPAREVKPRIGKEKLYGTLRFLYGAHPKGLGMTLIPVARILKKAPSTIRVWLHEAEDEGYLKVRPRAVRKIGHLVRFPENETERYELVDNEYVYTMYRHPDPDMRHFIGFIYSDGNIEDHQVRVFGVDWELLPFILNEAEGVARRYYVKAPVYHRDLAGRYVPKEEAYSWEIVIGSTVFARSLVNKGGLREDALSILFSPPFRGETLAGLWDGDGTLDVTRKYTVIDMNELHLPLLDRIYFALNEEGIDVTPPTLVDKRRLTKIIYGRPVKFTRPMYRVSVRVGGMPKWIEFVGGNMIHPKKRRQVKRIKELLDGTA